MSWNVILCLWLLRIWFIFVLSLALKYSKKRLEIRGGSRTIWCGGQWVNNAGFCGTWSEREAFRNFWGWPKKDKMRRTYTSDAESLSFWPIYHRQSTNILLTISIGRVSTPILTEIPADSRSICQPWLGRYLSWYIGRYFDRHISVIISAENRSIGWATYWLSVGYLFMVVNISVDMSTDI